MGENVELNHAEETRHRLTDEDAHRAVELVIEQGKSFGHAAGEMFPAEYFSPKKEVKSRAITRVRHLVRRALRRGILKVRAPRNDELAQRLRALEDFGDVTFHIVNDNADFAPLDPAEPVYREAASIVAERIDGLMEKKSGEIVIANAGDPA